MKKIVWLVPFLLLALSSSFAASQKEVRTALKEKFEITKRSLDGEVKGIGTVIYLTIPGVTAERPVFAAKTIAIKDGVIVSEDLSADASRQPLSVGEPMHIYLVQARKNSVRFLLGTESKYPASFLGGSMDVHLQTALDIELDGGYESKNIESIFAEIAKAAVTEQGAAARPELISAAMEIRKTNASAAEQRRLDKQQARTRPAQNEQQSAPTTTGAPSSRQTNSRASTGQSGNSQQLSSAAQLRTDEVTRIAGEGYQEISCNAAEWDGVVENIGDLFECDKVRAIQSLSQGRRIKMTVNNPQFSNGSFYVTTSRYPSYSTEIFNRIKDKKGQVSMIDPEWINLQSRRKAYKARCKFAPSAMGSLKEGESYEVSATLMDFSGTTATFECDASD